MTEIRREHLLRGVIQGVGFRPHVAAVAALLGRAARAAGVLPA